MDSVPNSKQIQEDPEISAIQESIANFTEEFASPATRKSCEAKIIGFLNENFSKSVDKLRKNEARRSFLIIKALESLCYGILDQISGQNEEVAKTLTFISQSSNDPSSFKIDPLLQVDVNMIKKALPISSKPFTEKLVTHHIICVNNLAAIMTYKSKAQKAIASMLRTIQIRLRHMNFFDSFVMLGILYLNTGYILYSVDNDNEAHLFLNRGIFILEEVDRFSQGKLPKDFPGDVLKMISLLQLTESETIVPPADKAFEMLPTLHLAYRFYAQVLGRLQRKDEATFVMEQAEYIRKKIAERSEKRQTSFKMNEDVPSSDNLSSLSMKTTSFLTSETYLNNLEKKNIVFQKYVDVNETKYKIVMLELPELRSLEVFIYNKPANFLRKLFILDDELVAFAKKSNARSFETEKTLERLLLRLASQLYIKDNELYLKEIQYYRKIDEVLAVINGTQ